MFWIILCIIHLVLIIVINRCVRIASDAIIVMIICIVVCVASGLTSVILGLSGMTDYPYLNSKLAEIEILEKRVENIRNAYYEHKKDGTLVAGNIENVNQSTNLTKYINDLALKEAWYNNYLQRAKDYQSIFILRFFGDGWAISDRIHTLPVRG